MAVTLLASSVSLGNVLRLGVAHVRKTALDAAPLGLNSLHLGSVRLSSVGRGGRSVAFNLVLEQQATLALRLDFDSNLRPIVPQGLDGLRVGAHGIANAAQSFTPLLGETLRMGAHVVSDRASWVVRFHLLDEKLATLGLQFNFGGGSVIAARGFDSLSMGQLRKVAAALGARAQGWDSLIMGRWRASISAAGASVRFDLVDAKPASLGLHFAFGGGMVVSAPSLASLRMGLASITNAAQSFTPSLGETLRMGAHVVSDRASWVVRFHLRNVFNQGGINVVFAFSEAIRSVDAWGFLSLRMGGVVADLAIRLLAAFGWNSRALGDVMVSRQGGIDNFYPSGWMSGGLGEPMIRNSQQFVRPLSNTGYERFTEFGNSRVYIPERQYVHPSGVAAFGVNVLHHIGHFYRYILQHDPYIGGELGNAYIGEKTRRVDPFWFQATQWGGALVGRNVPVYAQGFEPLEFGVARLTRGHEVLATGQALTQFGEAHRISESPQRAWVEQRGSTLAVSDQARVFNSVQYIEPIENYSVRLFHVVSNGAWIFNVKRHVLPNGMGSFTSSPLHYVRNRAEACLPEGLDATEYGRAFISNFVRTIPAPGFESLRFVNFNRVHNAARAIYPLGIAQAASVSKADILNINRFYKAWGLTHSEFGRAFIAPRIRTLTQLLPTDTLRLGRAYIGWLEAYLAPRSIEGTQMTPPIVWSRPIPRITPYMPLQFRSGTEHKVRNKTPNIYPQGRPYSEFGLRAWVSHSPRYPQVEPWTKGTTWGWTHVSRRDRTMGPTVGWNSFSPPTFDTRIATAWQPIVFPQTIVCEWLKDKDAIGVPGIFGTLLQPVGILSLAMSEDNNIRAMGAIVRTFYPHTQWGVHKVNSDQMVKPKGIQHSDSEDTNSYYFFGKPRMSPHTIWAQPMEDVPAQAVRNHPLKKYQTPSPDGVRDIGAAFGLPIIPHLLMVNNAGVNGGRGRGLKPLILFGDLEISLRRRFLLVGESVLLRMGFPVLIGGRRRLRTVGFTQETLGGHEVALRGTSIRTLSPVNNNFFKSNGTVVELKNRVIKPSGFEGDDYGNNDPMVHYPLRLVTRGVDNDQYGAATWVSYRHRRLPVEGFESDAVSYWTAGYFNGRMRIRQNSHIRGVGGIFSQDVGKINISNKQHRVFVYGISPRCIPENGIGIRHA